MADSVAQQQKAKRLAIALRENLKRRKAQARGRMDEAGPLTEPADKMPAPPPPPPPKD